ncbi:hypothetical protein FN846DRAFT_927350 [Sphaerosporella brunnea]|uniref:Uncharacterized protein n=1 Tax=Sphaerosporella brunnea TaxID=1250544 RepID=A0A5J5FA64_9PEZI|nr:hypothetical protein FN846DRAFT_927350 [Sphaerosporella brunnea]
MVPRTNRNTGSCISAAVETPKRGLDNQRVDIDNELLLVPCQIIMKGKKICICRLPLGVERQPCLPCWIFACRKQNDRCSESGTLSLVDSPKNFPFCRDDMLTGPPYDRGVGLFTLINCGLPLRYTTTHTHTLSSSIEVSRVRICVTLVFFCVCVCVRVATKSSR